MMSKLLTSERTRYVAGVISVVLVLLLPLQAVGQSGDSVLEIPVDAQNAALGGTSAPTSRPAASSLFSNAASLALIEGSGDVYVGYMSRLGRDTYALASAAFRPVDGRYGVIGATVMHVDYKPLVRGFRENDLTARSASLGYSHWLGEHTAFGLRLTYRGDESGAGPSRLVKHDLEGDLALLFSTLPGSYRISIMAENFLPPFRARLHDSDVSALPNRFLLGGSANLTRLSGLLTDAHQLWATTGYHTFNQHLGAGLEFVESERFVLRAGYQVGAGDFHAGRDTPSGLLHLGLGLRQPLGERLMRLDYSYSFQTARDRETHSGALHRLGASISL